MSKASLTKFWKCQSEGNDFVIFDGSKTKTPSLKKIRQLCDRISGIGANGVILMSKSKAGWSWKFYNEDGSTADMCGNGAKCAALWLKKYGKLRGPNWKWQSALGTVQAALNGTKQIWVSWPIPSSKPQQNVITELGDILDGLNERGLAYLAFVDVGIPHLVLINHESWTSTDRSALNQQLRHHPAFGKAGTNVSWHSLATGESVTFERGVEGETLACGTGAIAIFKALEDMHRVGKKSTLRFPGGNLLVRRGTGHDYWLGGHPQEVFIGHVELSQL